MNINMESVKIQCKKIHLKRQGFTLSASRKLINVFSFPLTMLVVGVGAHYILPSDNLFLLIVKLLIGVFALFYVPGYCITRSLFNKDASLSYDQIAVKVVDSLRSHRFVDGNSSARLNNLM